MELDPRIAALFTEGRNFVRNGTVYWIEPERAHLTELPFTHARS